MLRAIKSLTAIGRLRPFGVLSFCVAMLAMACNPNIQSNNNANSGDDGERGRAGRMALNEPVNDNVNLNEGDMTDWKYFQIPAAGEIEVILGCDYTSAFCTAVVRDEVGVEIGRLETSGTPRIADTMAVQTGNYYLEVFVPAAGTDYTVQVNYEPH